MLYLKVFFIDLFLEIWTPVLELSLKERGLPMDSEGSGRGLVDGKDGGCGGR